MRVAVLAGYREVLSRILIDGNREQEELCINMLSELNNQPIYGTKKPCVNT